MKARLIAGLLLALVPALPERAAMADDASIVMAYGMRRMTSAFEVLGQRYPLSGRVDGHEIAVVECPGELVPIYDLGNWPKVPCLKEEGQSATVSMKDQTGRNPPIVTTITHDSVRRYLSWYR